MPDASCLECDIWNAWNCNFEIAILIFQDNSNAKLGKLLIFQAKVCKKNLAKNESRIFKDFAILIWPKTSSANMCTLLKWVYINVGVPWNNKQDFVSPIPILMDKALGLKNRYPGDLRHHTIELYNIQWIEIKS